MGDIDKARMVREAQRLSRVESTGSCAERATRSTGDARRLTDKNSQAAADGDARQARHNS